PDPVYRTTFLKLTRNLAPTGKSFESIELRSAGESRPVSLGVEARTNIRKALKTDKEEPQEAGAATEDLCGTLRAVHLDRDWLDVMINGVSTRIIGLKDDIDDVIGPMVNRTVVVRATLAGGKYQYVDIELA